VLETEGKKQGRFGPANPPSTDALIAQGKLLARGRLEHSYPHSWRSKAPVIYRNTPQWFIRLDEAADDRAETLRELALAGIDQTHSSPSGRNRIRGMVEGPPDWLISRQRAWGTPIAMFVDRETGEPLLDDAVNTRIQEIIAAEGADAWFTPPRRRLPPRLRPRRLRAHRGHPRRLVRQRLDHAFTLESRNDTHWPPTSTSKAPTSIAAGSSLPAGGQRHAGRASVQGGADPRVHPGRAGRKMSSPRATPSPHKP
jgi:isoleucyl-tRNA synthetase